MKKDNKVYLQDILLAIQKIEKYVEHVSFDKFATDLIRQDAVIRQFEIIGEAFNKLTKDFVKCHTDLPVSEAVAMRNMLIHAYDEIDINTVWKTINKDLPELKSKVEKIFLF